MIPDHPASSVAGATAFRPIGTPLVRIIQRCAWSGAYVQKVS